MTTVEVSASAGVLDLELGRPIPPVVGVPALGARCLVRMAGRPIGTTDLPGPTSRIEPDQVAELIWAQLGPVVATTVRRSGRPAPDVLTSAGVGTPPPPPRHDVARSITVAIATRDRADILARCLASVLAAAPAPAAVVVVDNAPSDDRTRRLVAEVYGDDARVTYVAEPRPGLGRAHNAALPHVQTRYVAFTDDDVVVDSGWVGALEEAFSATADVACVTGLIAPAELRTREQWWVERSTGFGKGYERRTRSMRSAAGEGPLFPYDAGTLGSGANMAFTTAFLADIGGFDPALGTGTASMGGDDLAALHWTIALGHDLVYEPAAIVFHPHHDNLPALQRQARGYGAGLTAYLASVAMERPTAIVDVARRSGAGLRYAFARTSPLNERRPGDYPRSLVRRERLGMVTGAARYVGQRRRDRRHERTRP